MKKLFGLMFFFCVLVNQSWAKQTTYLAFEEPPGWNCELSQGGVYLCQSPKEQERNESLIIVFGAPVSDWDTLANYENYLGQKKEILDDSGKPLSSTVTYVRRRNVNGFEWVDSLQKDSELAGFWTRYVATVHKTLAILVTYVVSNEKYAELTPAFERMVASLKPKTDFKLVSTQNDLLMPGTELGGVLKNQISNRLQKKTVPIENATNQKEALSFKTVLLMGTLALAIAVFLIRRRKNKAQ